MILTSLLSGLADHFVGKLKTLDVIFNAGLNKEEEESEEVMINLHLNWLVYVKALEEENETLEMFIWRSIWLESFTHFGAHVNMQRAKLFYL